MVNVLLISEDTIKTYSTLPDNVWGKFLLPAIVDAQNMSLQKYTGSELYHKLLSEVSGGTISGAYKTLIDDYIHPFLIYQVLANLVPILGTKISNLGAIVTNDEHITNLSQSERELVSKYYQDRADYYTLALQKYLLTNYTSFPELMEEEQTVYPELISAYSSTLWLGGKRGKWPKIVKRL